MSQVQQLSAFREIKRGCYDHPSYHGIGVPKHLECWGCVNVFHVRQGLTNELLAIVREELARAT
jgi:hypothetical protein